MCGRFNILSDVDSLLTAFEILHDRSELSAYEPRYNISPSPRNKLIDLAGDFLTTIPFVRLDEVGERVLRSAIWPFVPIWSRGTIPKYSTANARSETMTTAASYRAAWKNSRRCLIPATGFYEWQVVGTGRPKQPWHIQHADQAVMSFAGLWEQGYTDDGEAYESCAIVTTQANELMAEIHNTNQRMPVIVDPDDRDAWLSDDHDAAIRLARTYDDGRLRAYPISARVNNPRYSAPDCVERLELPS
ncbi:MAG: SOS response-associated peptidase [Acidiferrobacterales bacterium]|nr:SOS response-associated peptidase [Acidiferrobacterales bacterium]